MSYDRFSGDSRSFEGAWDRLSQVAVKGAEYDSPERQPHPKCLEGTRVNLLDHIHGSLDNREKSRLIWLHGTAGVGKSAVAFTVAERMKSLKVTEQTNIEKRLAGTFFFSRKHTQRCTTGYFFATLAYQLACNFPSVKKDVKQIIVENPALLDPNKSLRDQMEALFLRPLRKLRSRLHECPPLVFVVDALDECVSEAEVADLISLLARALREPDLPVIHILLTSRLEEHIRDAIQQEEVRPLVCEIPVKITGEGVAAIISLDGADVDNDIYIFLEHSFRKLQGRYPIFPQPTRDELARLASRAGRRFIVASTMMKFIDDGYHDPRDRLQLMLEFTSELLPGTEVYKLYDHILATCTEPARAYRHLSVVAALADPLPISEISELLGLGEGRDVETALVQLRSVMDIPTDSSLPVNIYHSSVRDYVADPSNSSLPEVQHNTPAHSLLAESCFRLMMRHIPESTALLTLLSEMKSLSRAHRQRLAQKQSRTERRRRAMMHHEPQTVKYLLSFVVQPLESLQVLTGLLWLGEAHRSDLLFWLGTLDGRTWLQTCHGLLFLTTREAEGWVQTRWGEDWLQAREGKYWLLEQTGRYWLQTQGGKDWLQTQGGKGWLQSQLGMDWLQTPGGKRWLKVQSGQDWLQTDAGRDWLQTERERAEPQTKSRQEWLQTESGREWLQTQSAHEWLQTKGGRDWIWTQNGGDWLQTESGKDWLQTGIGKDWLYSMYGQNWLVRKRQPQVRSVTPGKKVHVIILERSSAQTPVTMLQEDRVVWLQTEIGQDWLKTDSGRAWKRNQFGLDWRQIQGGKFWLQTQGDQQKSAQDWLKTQSAQDWLQTQSGRDWLQTQSAQDWLQTPDGQAWQLTAAAAVWVSVEEFSSTSQAIKEYTFHPELSSLPAFQAIQQFKSLPDFMKFPAFLALRQQDHTTYALPQGSVHMEIIHAMKKLANFGHEAQEQSRSGSGALDYACQNWAFHLSRAPNDDMLNRQFQSFWHNRLLSWLERQWCSKGLRSCLPVLVEGQKLVLPKPGLSDGQEFAKDHCLSIRNLSILCLVIGLLLAYCASVFYSSHAK